MLLYPVSDMKCGIGYASLVAIAAGSCMLVSCLLAKPPKHAKNSCLLFSSMRSRSVNCWGVGHHYNDVIMSAMVSQITSSMIVYSAVYPGADQREHQSSASLAFVRGIPRWPVNSAHKRPVTRKMPPFDDVIMHWISLCKEQITNDNDNDNEQR